MMSVAEGFTVAAVRDNIIVRPAVADTRLRARRQD
jgi:hypothetical protein